MPDATVLEGIRRKFEALRPVMDERMRRHWTAVEATELGWGGSSNSHRSRLWKVSLQDLADEIGLKLVVCHFPPGTSKGVTAL